MKLFLTFVLILGFAGIALFGFAAMSHDMSQSNNDCPAIFLQNGVSCPRLGGAFADAAYHIGALKNFLSARIGDLLILFFLIFASFIFTGRSLSWLICGLKSLFRALSRALLDLLGLPLKRQFIRWLLSRINSPSVL